MPLISAVTITDTTFKTSETNYTVFVNSVTLEDGIIVTNTSIQFFGVNSTGSTFTNTNDTFISIIEFIDLKIGIKLTNLNTGTDIFTSRIFDQDVDITILPGQVIITSNNVALNACEEMIVQFGVFPALVGLVGTIIFLGAIIFVLVNGFTQVMSMGIDGPKLVAAILVVVGMGVLVIVGIVILSSMCAIL